MSSRSGRRWCARAARPTRTLDTTIVRWRRVTPLGRLARRPPDRPLPPPLAGNDQRVVECSHLRVIGGAQFPTDMEYSQEFKQLIEWQARARTAPPRTKTPTASGAMTHNGSPASQSRIPTGHRQRPHLRQRCPLSPPALGSSRVLLARPLRLSRLGRARGSCSSTLSSGRPSTRSSRASARCSPARARAAALAS
eukprot:1666701-Prymnesium_polylepis.2